eukprot:TRINITY_DN42197_c0_g1_i1.p2 TRINITY_DN42197_c0_g1~~TRINITY_DN42197_c0_g1_i1.p2  ORF type:complete len:176 (-),score=50.07 TRINITY_DN42197_c0_g1_i1:27-554(-)
MARSRDLLVGIFADSPVPPALAKPQLGEVQPAFLDAGSGYVLPKGFDNDRAIKDYEEALHDLLENGGWANPSVAMVCAGLATLYDTKAAIDKDAKCYDRSMEYVSMLQQAMQGAMGPAALSDPGFLQLEARKEKLMRKKERRLAKGPPGPEMKELLARKPEMRKPGGDSNVVVTR